MEQTPVPDTASSLRGERDRALVQEATARADAERVKLALAAGAIIGTWFWDLPSDRFTVDEAFARSFGLDPALGREGLSLEQVIATVHPDDRQGLIAAINEAIGRGGAYAHQYRVRRTDGGYYWIEANGRVDLAPDGTGLRFPGVLLDVEKRRADAMLANLAERLRTLYTPQAMALAAAESVGVALGLSRAAYGDIDVAGRHIVIEQDWLAEGQLSIAGRHDFDAYGSYVQALRRGEDVTIDDVTTDPRTMAQAESFRPIAVGALINLPLMERGRLKVVFCLNHSSPHAWSVDEIAFARRVMERTEVEIARRAAEDKLRALNASLERQVAERTADRNALWRLSSDIMLRCTFDGVMTAVNPAWTKLLGWREDELLGAKLFDLIHPDDMAHTIQGARQLSEGTGHTRFDNRYRHRDGSYRWISWSAQPADNMINAVGRDCTAEKEQAEALAQAEDALRQSQKMEAVGQLTGGVAHDFNNLLTIIRSSVDLLRRPNLSEERRARYMDAVSDTVDRAAKLTGQLLAFARRQALKPEVFDVGAKLRGVGDMLDTVTGARIRLITEVPDQPCFVRADLSQLETALVNMAVNARDAMDGEGTLTLRLDATAQIPVIRGHGGSRSPFAAVSVTDSGAGIPPERLAQIFEPFFTTKEVGKGTGLGLSQVFGFAKQSGGNVDVASTVGRGTTFTLYLPQVNVGTPTEKPDDARTALAPVGGGQRVLVVEDNVEVGRFCTHILDDLGYVTAWAKSAEEALVLLRTAGARFDAVFSDVVMPGMGGVALAETLRERWPDLPVVLASGYSHVLAREADHGCDLLHKPYSAEQLARVLRRVRARRSATSLQAADA